MIDYESNFGDDGRNTDKLLYYLYMCVCVYTNMIDKKISIVKIVLIN